MGHRMPLASPKRQVLVVTAPNDQQAIELVQALRAQGLNTTIAETVSLAALADEVAVCIIVLRPGIWRTTPSITTAVRCHPRYMIPVLAEPMPLPNSSWATEPISIKESLDETAKELEVLITAYMQTLPEPKSAFAEPYSAESFVRLPTVRRTGLWKNIRYLLLALILLLVAGLLVRYLPRIPTLTNKPLTLPTATYTLPNSSYAAAVPGPCGVGGNEWQIGSYYKALVTPVATVAKTPVQATPTLQVIVDNSTQTTCQQDGLLVKHTDHFDSYATIIFTGNGQTFPHHFRTQVTATVVTATDTARFDLGVRQQDGALGTNGTNNGYGDDMMDVGVDGSWFTQRVNDVTDQVDATFTKGFVTPAKTFTLAAEVDGPLMTFSINEHKVTTAFDTAYPESYGLAFGISDPDAKSPPSALFSHFVYTPLGDTHLSTPAALATATAQIAHASQMPYMAAVPGFGCDQGAGQWEPATEATDYVTTGCLPNGLAISQRTPEKYVGRVSFYWLNGNFPANYKVEAHIDTSGLGSSGCAGITTRIAEQLAGGYAFFVCSNGSWQIESYDSNGKGHSLSQGQVAQSSSYSMEAVSNGPAQSLLLDGTQVGSVNDKTYTATDHIELNIFLNQGSTGTAIFSNFVFTPLP